MADNKTLPLTGAGDVTAAIRTVEKTAVHTQSVVLDIGGAGAESFLVPGQLVSAGSLPVVIASDQSAVPVSAASLPLPTGAATAALQLPNSHDVTVDNAAGAAAVNIQDGGNVITVDGTVGVSGTVTVDGSAVTQPISAATLPLPTGAATSALQLPNSHDVTVDNAAGASAVNVQDGGNSLTVDAPVGTPVFARLSDGAAALTTTGGRLAVDPSGVTSPVSIAASVTVAQATASNLNAQIVGSVASGVADSGNPIKTGGQARNAEITAVANANRVDFIADLVGKQVVLPYAIPEKFTYGSVAAAMTGTADTAVIATPGASLRLYITQITITNDHATVGTVVNIKDGASTMYKVYAAAAGGGATITMPVPLRLTANTALNAANVTTGSSVYVSASGYIAP